MGANCNERDECLVYGDTRNFTYSIILIEKIQKSCRYCPNLIKNKKINRPVEQIIDSYQGFEGDLILFFEVHDEAEIEAMIKQCYEFYKLSDCSLLHIISHSDEIPSFPKNNAIKMGYDVGICEFEGMFYSSIFHEVLFGKVNELVAYKDFLNEHLLFQDKSLAEQYVNLHRVLDSQEKDVEHENMIIYEIWQQRDFAMGDVWKK